MRDPRKPPRWTQVCGAPLRRQVIRVCARAIDRLCKPSCSTHLSTLSTRSTAETMPRSAARTVGCAILLASVECTPS